MRIPVRVCVGSNGPQVCQSVIFPTCILEGQYVDKLGN